MMHFPDLQALLWLDSFMQLHPVWYFKWCYPVAAADGFLALLTGVGVQALIALHTVRVFLTKNILLPKQRLLTVVAVISLCHLYFCLSVLWWRVWVWGDVWKRQNLWEDECYLYVYIFFSSYHYGWCCEIFRCVFLKYHCLITYK